MDDFVSLSNRLLNRAPSVGLALSQQFINDSWRTLQSRREWSFRRRHGTFSPPNLYTTGQATTNVATGSPTLITGIGTAWTPQMVGSQIRIGGLLFPYYTIVGWLDAAHIVIDQPWAGNDVVAQPYQILQIYYPVPADFGYWVVVVSIKDGYRLWTNVTETDLGLLDPQRTNQGQTYGIAFYDFSPSFGGIIGPVIPVAATGAAPISTTSTGYSYVANATYIIQVVTGGTTGTATFKWMRAGQTAFQPTVATADSAQDLSDGVQIYWPDSQTYVANDLFIINAQSLVSSGVPRYELWPAPTYSGYLYPFIYIAKEYDLTAQAPQLPPFVANRGEVLLEMALAKAATFPGTEENPNPYFSLALSQMHDRRATELIWDMERNDQEVAIEAITYQTYEFYPAPWVDGNWQQSHAPFLGG